MKKMDHKTRLDETNNMRNLMGLNVFSEEEVIGTGDTGDSDEAGAPESEKGLKKFDKDEIFEDDVIGTGDTGDSDEAGAPESEKGEEEFDKDEDKTNISEDSEGEETYNYGDDEGHDKEEEDHLEDEEKMAPADRVREIERHLDALKKDMGYDEDHEDRDEKGTDFYEQKTFNIKKNGKVVTLSESEIKKLNKLI